MKRCNYIIVLFIAVFCLTCYNSNAQFLDENTRFINQYFQLNNETYQTIKNLNVSATDVKLNFITIAQIGENNKVDIRSNNLDSQLVKQEGQNNYYNYINFYNSSPSNFNIIQQGNYNNLLIYGENSIINNMSVLQKSSFNTLIIKNY